MATMTTTKTAAVTQVMQLKVQLRGVRPPVWRKLMVSTTMTLAALHKAIQAAMGWHDCHLHVFEIDGRSYGDPRSVDDVANEARQTLNSLYKAGVDRFRYIYDFGDDWEHTVTIEKTVPAVVGTFYPACVGGKGRCPPEDCGGPWGYEELVAILADPDHPEHAERQAWVGDEFDPNEFSAASCNAMLEAEFKNK